MTALARYLCGFEMMKQKLRFYRLEHGRQVVMGLLQDPHLVRFQRQRFSNFQISGCN
jgi:hypothetical protein